MYLSMGDVRLIVREGSKVKNPLCFVKFRGRCLTLITCVEYIALILSEFPRPYLLKQFNPVYSLTHCIMMRQTITIAKRSRATAFIVMQVYIV